MRLQDWKRAHESDPRTLLPKVAEQVAAREAFSRDFGKRAAQHGLADANELHLANVRRTRAVMTGLEAVRERMANDPAYTVRQAQHDADVLRTEYERLAADLPRIAVKVEDARAIDADPLTWAENYFQRFPMLAERLPGLPPL